MFEMAQEKRFDDFLKLDVITISDYFTITELKVLLKTEPYNNSTNATLYNLMLQFADEEMYEWSAMLQKEIKRRKPLTIV
jgi:hypothetical protein